MTILLAQGVTTKAHGATELSCKDVYLTETTPRDPALPKVDQETPFSLSDLHTSHEIPSKLRDNFKLQLMSIFQTIENFYGPLKLKTYTLGLDWDALKAETLKKADQVKDTTEEYYLIADLVQHFTDSHVSVALPSTLIWTLPLQLRNIQSPDGSSKLVVNYIAPNYPDRVQSPDPGDELVSINGLSPDDFQKQYRIWNADANTITSKSLFALTFGRWSEARGLPLSSMKMDGLDLVFKNSNGALVKAYLPFTKSGVGLIDNVTNANFESAPPVPRKAALPAVWSHIASNSLAIVDQFHRMLHAELDQDSVADSKGPAKGTVGVDESGLAYRWGVGWSQEKGRKMGLGDVQPFFNLPPDFKKIQFPDELSQIPGLAGLIDTEFFTGGTFMKDGKTVGFLRIPSYAPDNLLSILPALRFYIAKLQASSDYLVIDQTNNPGGYVIFSDLIIKSLTGQYNLDRHLAFAVKPTQSFLRQYRELKAAISKNQDGLLKPSEVKEYVANLDKNYEKILQGIRENRELSAPISMTVMSDYTEKSLERGLLKALLLSPFKAKKGQITYSIPNAVILNKLLGMNVLQPQVYTKPVYFMINETDFSGGDATPASLQDYGRVKIVGAGSKRTAGAGGTVEEFNIRGLSEMVLRLTTSLMVRYNKKLVEQYGVHSDLDIPLTQNDVRDGFKTYFGRVMSKISADFAASKK
jgi:hypothetical protein